MTDFYGVAYDVEKLRSFIWPHEISKNVCKITNGNEVVACGTRFGKLYILKEGPRNKLAGRDRSRPQIFYTSSSRKKENRDQSFSRPYALTAVNAGLIQPSKSRVILCRNPADCNHASCH